MKSHIRQVQKITTCTEDCTALYKRHGTFQLIQVGAIQKRKMIYVKGFLMEDQNYLDTLSVDFNLDVYVYCEG